MASWATIPYQQKLCRYVTSSSCVGGVCVIVSDLGIPGCASLVRCDATARRRITWRGQVDKRISRKGEQVLYMYKVSK